MSMKPGLWSIAFLGCCCLSLGLLGCNGGGSGSIDSNIRPSGGNVTLNRTPVAGATVSFFAPGESTTAAATGTTDESGNFMLTTDFQDDGAAIGTYDVAITMAKPEGTESKPEAGTQLPEAATSPGTSGLKAEVKSEGENWFAFELGAK